MSNKDKFANSKKSFESGYISFTEEDLNRAKAEHLDNDEAYMLLDAAMSTSSHITEEDRNGDSVVIDNIYPCTAAECDEMDNLLNQAEKAVNDKNDGFFYERLNELRRIVSWSRKKHWTFKWGLIGGCVLAILGMFWMRNDAKKDAARDAKRVAVVENWVEQDTTIAYEKCTSEFLLEDLSTANICKKVELSQIKNEIVGEENSIKTWQHKADTTKSDHDKKVYQNYIKNTTEKMKKNRELYDKVNSMSFSEYKEHVLGGKEEKAAQSEKHSFWMYFWLIYVIVLIPAYIYYSHQYGYNITRYREETRVLGGIQKVFFAIASFFLGASLAMALLPGYEVTTIYADGHREKRHEENYGNFIILALKAILLFIGLLIFAITSVFIMTYVTLMSIKRNYAWSKVATLTKQAVNKTTGAMKDNGIDELNRK